MAMIIGRDGEIVVEGNKKIERIAGTNQLLIDKVKDGINDPPAIGGTYYPVPGSMLAAYTTILEMYREKYYTFQDGFNESDYVKVYGEIGEKMESDPEVIY